MTLSFKSFKFLVLTNYAPTNILHIPYFARVHTKEEITGTNKPSLSITG